ncbi:hypothetical protein J6590_072453 [Homalodisca vitripennis]|nr:hypothetical protein J6590_072453 [Homalodisca vitripennis]
MARSSTYTHHTFCLYFADHGSYTVCCVTALATQTKRLAIVRLQVREKVVGVTHKISQTPTGATPLWVNNKGNNGEPALPKYHSQPLQSRVAGSSAHSATKSTSCAARRQQTAQAVVVREVDTSQQTEDASDTSQQLVVRSKQTVKPSSVPAVATILPERRLIYCQSRRPPVALSEANIDRGLAGTKFKCEGGRGIQYN